MSSHQDNDFIEKVFSKKITRSNYSQFSKLQKSKLKVFFEQNNYPNKKEFESISQEILQPISKIINWFKHERRKLLTEKNSSKYKKRKVFKNEEQALLKDYFKKNLRPTSKNYTELADLLKCTKKQIKKWFSYRRIKLKKIRKTKKNSKVVCQEISNLREEKIESSSKIKIEATNETQNQKIEYVDVKPKNENSFNNNCLFNAQMTSCPPFPFAPFQYYPNASRLLTRNPQLAFNPYNPFFFDQFFMPQNANTLPKGQNQMNYIYESQLPASNIPLNPFALRNEMQNNLTRNACFNQMNQIMFMQNIVAMKP